MASIRQRWKVATPANLADPAGQVVTAAPVAVVPMLPTTVPTTVQTTVLAVLGVH